MEATSPASEHGQQRPRRSRLIVLILILLVAGLLLAPEIVARTDLKNTLLQDLLGNATLRISCQSASFSWWRPLKIDGLEIRSADEGVRIEIERLQADKSWFAMWLSSPNVGRLVIDGPRVEVELSDVDASDAEPPFDAELAKLPVLTAKVQSGALLVRERNSEQPAIDAKGIDFTFRIEQRDGSAMLIVDPWQVVDREPVTPAICEHGLQLVAPELADEVELSGSYSLEFQTIELDLARTTSANTSASMVVGTVTLHDLSAGLTSDVTRKLVLMAAEMMELGEVPAQISLAKDVRLDFRLADEGIQHAGMVLVLPEEVPDFQIRTSGSVGWDESIDLAVQVQVPAPALDETALAQELAAIPLQLRVSGSIDDPVLSVPEDQPWFRLLKQPFEGRDRELAVDILNTLNELSNQPNAS